MKSFKKLFLLAISVIVMLSFNNLFAQEQGNWKLVNEQNGIKVYSKVIVKQNESPSYKHEYYLFKYENTNKKEVMISWKLDVFYNGNCRTCGLQSPNEYELDLKLKAGEVTTGSFNSKDKIYKLFKKDLSKEQTGNTTFELNNFTVINNP